MRTLFKSGVWILFILLSLLIVLALFVSTDSGTKILVQVAQGLSNDIKIKGVQGSVIRELKVEELHWQNSEQKVYIKQLQLKNNLSTLLSKRLDLESLSMDYIQVDLEETSERSTTDIILPLTMQVDDLSIKQLVVNKGKTQHKINNIHLSAITQGQRLIISSLQAQPVINAIPADVYLEGEIELNSPYETHTKLKFDYNDPVQGQLKSTADVSGTIDAYKISAQVRLHSKQYNTGKLDLIATGTGEGLAIQTLNLDAFDGTASATGKVAWKDQISWKLALKADGLNMQRLAKNLPSELSTRFKTQGTWKDKIARGNIDLQALSGKFNDLPFSALGKVQLNGSQAKIEKLQLKALEGTADASGEIQWQADKDHITWDLQLANNNINTEKLLPQLPAIFSSQLKTQGKFQQGKIDAVIQLAKLKGKLHNYPLDAKGKIIINGQEAKIENLSVNALEGTLKTQGKLTWGDKIQWDVQLDTQKIKTKRFLPEWPAVLTIKLLSKGSHILKSTKTKVEVDLKSLSGTLQSYPLAAKGKLFLNDKTVRVEKIQLSSGNNTLFADGQATEPFNLEWKIKAKKLKQLYKGLKGNLQGEGRLQGSIEKPNIQAKLKGQSLAFQDYALAGIDLNIRQSRDQYNVDAKLNKLKFAQQLIQDLEIKGSGSLEKHQVAIKLNHTDANLAFKAAGGWKNKQWKGILKSLQLDKTPAGNWQLSQAVPMTLSEKNITTGQLCLKNQAAQLCAKNRWQVKGGLSSQGTLKNIPFSLLKPWLPKTVQFAPTAKADADFNIKQQKGSLKLRLSDSQLIVKPEGANTQRLNYQKVKLDARLNGSTLESEFSAHIAERGDISGKIKLVSLHNAAKQGIRGSVDIDIPTLKWANQFVPDVKNLQGRLNAQLKLSGLLVQPQVTGRANLVNGHFALPDTGTHIRNINLSLLSQQANKARITGSLQSGQGNLAIDGLLDVGKLDQWKARVSLKGKHLNFMNSYEIKGTVSPDLVIDATPLAVHITGTLAIPKTQIRLNDLPESAIHESDDVVIVGRNRSGVKGQSNKRTSVPFKIHPDIRIVMGNEVSFSGFGLQTKLLGQFRIREQQGDFFAEGHVKIKEGSYNAYGQELDITQGALVFNGPIDNPGMNIKAVRKLSNVEVGIHLTGTVQNPQTDLFSDPVLSQTDKLSYLLTGRSLSETSGDESGVLLSAITTLGISGGEGLARSLGQKLGLDSVNLTSDRGLKATDLELGKRLGPNLYLKYIVGLFDSVQSIAVEYQVNKRLALEAQSGSKQGFDLIYKMERD